MSGHTIVDGLFSNLTKCNIGKIVVNLQPKSGEDESDEEFDQLVSTIDLNSFS